MPFPVATSRIEIIDNPLAPTVRYYTEAEDKEELIEVSPLEFLAKLSVHIPKIHECTIRLYGLYSCHTRGAKKRDEKFKKLIENDFEPLELKEEQKPESEKQKQEKEKEQKINRPLTQLKIKNTK
jgi:hypothetical protein